MVRCMFNVDVHLHTQLYSCIPNCAPAYPTTAVQLYRCIYVQLYTYSVNVQVYSYMCHLGELGEVLAVLLTAGTGEPVTLVGRVLAGGKLTCLLLYSVQYTMCRCTT